MSEQDRQDFVWAWVKCANCGEQIMVAPELIGDVNPAEITDYVCGACDPDNGDDDEEFEQRDDTCSICDGTGLDYEGSGKCPKCDGEGFYWWL